MIQRIGVSLEGELLDRFDRQIARKGYTNRSEAIRDLIRASLVEEEWQDAEGTGLGVALIVFDHHTGDLPRRLQHHQHEHHELVVSSTHVHIDAHNCLEILILRGLRDEIRELAEQLISARGVKHGTFLPTTTGSGL